MNSQFNQGQRRTQSRSQNRTQSRGYSTGRGQSYSRSNTVNTYGNRGYSRDYDDSYNYYDGYSYDDSYDYEDDYSYDDSYDYQDDYSYDDAYDRRYSSKNGRNQRYSNGRRNSNNSYKRRKKRRKRTLAKLLFISVELAVLVAIIFFARNVYHEQKDPLMVAQKVESSMPDWIDVQYIDEGNPSRTGEKLDGINDIVVHYVGNPGTTAQQNRDFYNNLDTNVCSHFVVGMDGEIIQCIPLDEKSEASNHRNHDTISIEVCHPDDEGKFTDESYQSLIKLVDWLMDEFNLDTDHVIRHYDVTGKECPIYYVRHEDAWEQFKEDL